MNKIQNSTGALLAISSLILGALFLNTDMLFLRLLFGISLGYVLTRSFFGFAGSVNRAYNGGSTKLMQMIMLMFVLTAIVNAAFFLNGEVAFFDVWVNPINLGLVLGGLMFGFGMTFSSCCASGVMTDLATDLPRAGITLIFFAMGVYLGFPLQSSLPIINETLVSSVSYPGKGVFMPDLFGSGLVSYIGAILLTCFFAALVIILSKKYESHRIANGTFNGIDTEIDQNNAMKAKVEQTENKKQFKLLSRETYESLFVTTWSLKTGALMIVVIFTLMMATTQMGWGASTPYGIWFGKVLMLFGMSADSVGAFANKPTGMFLTPFFEHGISVQNFGIILGTLISVLLMGKFTFSFHYSPKSLALFAMGGFFMGMGTRFANGCC